MQKFFAGTIVITCGLIACQALADACSDLGSTGLGQSYTVNRTTVENCMTEGKDPPSQWIKQGGIASDVGGHENGVGAIIPVAQKPSNGSVPYYEGTGCGYNGSNTAPGGQLENGASDACSASGSGGLLASPPIALPFLPQIPTPNFTNCLSGLSANLSVNTSSACVSAALSACGSHIGGSLCTTPHSSVAGYNATPPITIGAGGNFNNPYLNLSGDDTTAISTPVTVSTATTMRLTTGGAIVGIPAGSTIVSNAVNGSEDLYNAAGTLTASYKTAGARLATPTGGLATIQGDAANTPYMQTILDNNVVDPAGNVPSPAATAAFNAAVPCASSGTCGGS